MLPMSLVFDKPSRSGFFPPLPLPFRRRRTTAERLRDSARDFADRAGTVAAGLTASAGVERAREAAAAAAERVAQAAAGVTAAAPDLARSASQTGGALMERVAEGWPSWPLPLPRTAVGSAAFERFPGRSTSEHEASMPALVLTAAAGLIAGLALGLWLGSRSHRARGGAASASAPSGRIDEVKAAWPEMNAAEAAPAAHADAGRGPGAGIDGGPQSPAVMGRTHEEARAAGPGQARDRGREPWVERPPS